MDGFANSEDDKEKTDKSKSSQRTAQDSKNSNEPKGVQIVGSLIGNSIFGKMMKHGVEKTFIQAKKSDGIINQKDKSKVKSSTERTRKYREKINMIKNDDPPVNASIIDRLHFSKWRIKQKTQDNSTAITEKSTSNLIRPMDMELAQSSPNVHHDKPEASDVMKNSNIVECVVDEIVTDIRPKDIKLARSSPNFHHDIPEASDVMKNSNIVECVVDEIVTDIRPKDIKLARFSPNVHHDKPEASDVMKNSNIVECVVDEIVTDIRPKDIKIARFSPNVHHDKPEASAVSKSSDVVECVEASNSTSVSSAVLRKRKIVQKKESFHHPSILQIKRARIAQEEQDYLNCPLIYNENRSISKLSSEVIAQMAQDEMDYSNCPLIYNANRLISKLSSGIIGENSQDSNGGINDFSQNFEVLDVDRADSHEATVQSNIHASQDLVYADDPRPSLNRIPHHTPGEIWSIDACETDDYFSRFENIGEFEEEMRGKALSKIAQKFQRLRDDNAKTWLNADGSLPSTSSNQAPKLPEIDGTIDNELKKISQLGSWLKGVDLSSLKQPESSQQHLANRGLIIASNVLRGLKEIKKDMGPLSKNTIFGSTAQLFQYLTGVHVSSLTKTRKSRELVKKSRKERRRRAAERLGTGNKLKLATFLQECWKEEIQVTLEKLQSFLSIECKFDVSQTSLNDMMHGLGYTFRKKSGTPLIEERRDLIILREKYLFLVDEFENAAIEPYFGYFDETWIFEGMTSEYDWAEKEETMYKIARMGDIDQKRSGPAKGKNKGKRAYVLAVMTSDGILPGSAKVIIPGEDKQLMDYHSMMTAKSYEEYMEEIIPLFVAEARKQGKVPVMVIDNSPLHNATVEKIPQRNAKKSDLADFLAKHGRRTKLTWNKARLQREFDNLLAANGGRNAMKKFKVDDWAMKKYGCHFLRLPPYHCCFNPIELVWGKMKGWLKSQGRTTDRLELVKRRAESWLAELTATEARNFIRRTKFLENAIREKIKEKNRAAAAASNITAQNTSDDDDDDDNNWSTDDTLSDCSSTTAQPCAQDLDLSDIDD